MNENDGNIEEKPVYGAEVLNEPWPWYLRKWVWIIGLLVVLWYLFDRPVKVTYGPWQVFDLGQPVGHPYRFEVLREGEGASIEQGDLIQISVWKKARDPAKEMLERYPPDHALSKRDVDMWLWVATEFSSADSRLAAVFVGQKEGTMIRITESLGNKEMLRCTLLLSDIPFGYECGNSFGHNGTGHASFRYVNSITLSESSMLFVEKVFKGELKYRKIHLYDAAWGHFKCYGGIGSPLRCDSPTTPREAWVDEARFDGVSEDGKRATFQQGPDPFRAGYHDRNFDWAAREWLKLPLRVQGK